MTALGLVGNFMNRLVVYAQLVRLPNVFTALADIVLGLLATWSLMPQALSNGWVWNGLCLLLASACLYSGGMVWNDVFDLEQDRRERPFRPIPSGRVSHRTAFFFGLGLLLAGQGFALLAGWRQGRLHWLSGDLAGCLVAFIVLYDVWLKRTWAGPLGMGLCRFLNVLMGMSLLDNLVWPEIHLALVVGIYIAGVTWFARTEAHRSNPKALTWSAGVMLAGLLLALPLPAMASEYRYAPNTSPLFPYLLVALGFLVGIPVCRAISRPGPSNVQPAVKWAIMGLVILDATLATALAGTVGLAILILLLPALYLGRWIYST
jgi:4-hydroxybenzoate polyprenyltransferase